MRENVFSPFLIRFLVFPEALFYRTPHKKNMHIQQAYFIHLINLTNFIICNSCGNIKDKSELFTGSSIIECLTYSENSDVENCAGLSMILMQKQDVSLPGIYPAFYCLFLFFPLTINFKQIYIKFLQWSLIQVFFFFIRCIAFFRI